MIEITEVRVSLRNDDKLKAFVSITLNDSFVIRGLKIIRGNSGLFVAMPSRKRPDGQHQDLAHPINDSTRKYLTERVMAEYERELSHPTPDAPGPSLPAGCASLDRDGNPVLLVGRGQAVRHETLDLASGGSNPPAPAIPGRRVRRACGLPARHDRRPS